MEESKTNPNNTTVTFEAGDIDFQRTLTKKERMFIHTGDN